MVRCDYSKIRWVSKQVGKQKIVGKELPPNHRCRPKSSLHHQALFATPLVSSHPLTLQKSYKTYIFFFLKYLCGWIFQVGWHQLPQSAPFSQKYPLAFSFRYVIAPDAPCPIISHNIKVFTYFWKLLLKSWIVQKRTIEMDPVLNLQIWWERFKMGADLNIIHLFYQQFTTSLAWIP